MKVLLDSCVWGPVLTALQAAGHEGIWAGEWPEDPGDEEILARAFQEQRVLVTLDKDFGELVFLLGRPHPGMVRLVDIAAQEQGPILLGILERFQAELQAKALITVSAGRVRVRML